MNSNVLLIVMGLVIVGGVAYVATREPEPVSTDTDSSSDHGSSGDSEPSTLQQLVAGGLEGLVRGFRSSSSSSDSSARGSSANSAAAKGAAPAGNISGRAVIRTA